LKIGNKNYDFMRGSEALIPFNCQTRGKEIEVKYVKENDFKGYFYSDKLEGWTSIPEKDIKIGSTIKVIPVSHSTGEYGIV
jgi:hypothetical protein